jgi:hypothetical protein
MTTIYSTYVVAPLVITQTSGDVLVSVGPSHTYEFRLRDFILAIEEELGVKITPITEEERMAEKFADLLEEEDKKLGRHGDTTREEYLEIGASLYRAGMRAGLE